MLAFLAPILVFGLVIFVHELGHFLAAKSVGVYAPRFSIGFGPALWRRRRGETEYIVAAFPLGGYVRMASRHDEATAFLEGGSEEAAATSTEKPKDYDPDAMIPFGPKPVPEHRWFESKPLWARIYILLAGVTMNVVLSLVCMIGLALHFGRPVIPTRVVGAVRAIAGVPALSAAIERGDTIRAVNGIPVQSWSDVRSEISSSTTQISIETNRGTTTIPLNREDGPTAAAVAEALEPELPPRLGDLLPGEPAAQAGFQAGDSIVAVDNQPVRGWFDILVAVSNAPGREISVDVARNGEKRTFQVTPRATQGVHPLTGAEAQVGKIGAYPPDVSIREPVSLGEGIIVGSRATWGLATSTVQAVRDLVTRKLSVDQLSGPIGIARASVQAAQSGLESLFYLIALLSVSVAIFNVLPIPVFDGGNILINVLESIRRRPFSLRTREYVLRGGLVFIVLLFALVMFNDTRGFFQWLYSKLSGV